MWWFAKRSEGCIMVCICWNRSWYAFILIVDIISFFFTNSIMLGISFLWDDCLGGDPSLALILWVQSVGFKPFMSWMFHPKFPFLSLKIHNNFSSLVSCKHIAIIVGREDGGLIKTYLKLEGEGFNSTSGGSLTGGFIFGTMPHFNLLQLGGSWPCWEWRNVNISSTLGLNPSQDPH